MSLNENVSPPHDGVNLPARCDEISGAALERSRVALAMPGRRCRGRRHKARIDIAEAAIAGDHMRRAFFDSAKFAIPHHVAGAEILHRAPRRVTEAAGVSGRNAHRRRQQGGRRQCADGSHGFSLGRRCASGTLNGPDAGKLTVPGLCRQSAALLEMHAHPRVADPHDLAGSRRLGR
jgi:hypothetical protein